MCLIVLDLDLFFYLAFNSRDHIVMGSLWVGGPVHIVQDSALPLGIGK